MEWTSLPHTLLIYVFYSRFEVLFDEDSIEGSPRPNTFPFPLFRYPQKKGCEYKFHTEFQSHEPEFDYLKSLEIEEKINKIKWCRRQNAAHFLLSTNDKTIKLWKVFEKSLKVVAENNLSSGATPSTNSSSLSGGAGPSYGAGNSITSPPPSLISGSGTSLRLPRLTHHDTIVAAVPRKIYANAHAYHINSISVNSDGETYISADDLRINLWNLNISDQSFSKSMQTTSADRVGAMRSGRN